MSHRKLLKAGLLALVLIASASFGLLRSLNYNIPRIFREITLSENKKTSGIVEVDSKNDFARVVRVIDGDTIEIERGERVRYIGIDTPETVDHRKPVQCFGAEASKENKKLVLGRIVRLEKDITDKDKYGRLLRYVWLGEVMVNESLVAAGFAYSYSYPPDIKYQDRFVVAERKAREARLGLWNTCGI